MAAPKYAISDFAGNKFGAAILRILLKVKYYFIGVNH